MKPSSNREDDFATQVRTSASQLLNYENSPSPELAEHMETNDFLTSETAYRLWNLKSELQMGPNTNESITSCRCQLHDLMEDMVCLWLLSRSCANLRHRHDATYVVCNSILSAKATWVMTADLLNTSATFVCSVVRSTEPLLQSCVS